MNRSLMASPAGWILLATLASPVARPFADHWLLIWDRPIITQGYYGNDGISYGTRIGIGKPNQNVNIYEVLPHSQSSSSICLALRSVDLSLGTPPAPGRMKLTSSVLCTLQEWEWQSLLRFSFS